MWFSLLYGAVLWSTPEGQGLIVQLYSAYCPPAECRLWAFGVQTEVRGMTTCHKGCETSSGARVGGVATTHANISLGLSALTSGGTTKHANLSLGLSALTLRRDYYACQVHPRPVFFDLEVPSLFPSYLFMLALLQNSFISETCSAVEGCSLQYFCVVYV